jgi:hypothetical protein
MTTDDYNQIQMMLCGESFAILGRAGVKPEDAYSAMLNEPDFLRTWWGGAFEQSPEEEWLLDAAAREFAYNRPLPDLTVAQLARLSLRMRLGSRFIRALSNRQYSTKRLVSK